MAVATEVRLRIGLCCHGPCVTPWGRTCRRSVVEESHGEPLGHGYVGVTYGVFRTFCFEKAGF